jgi:hypothetical protein
MNGKWSGYSFLLSFSSLANHGENQRLTPVDVHPQLSNNGHPVDGALLGAGSPMTGT